MKTIEKTYQMPFPSHQVYSAWVSSETVVPPATQLDIDPVVGGHYRLIMKGEDHTSMNEGRFSVVVPGKRLVYSWEWNKDGEVTQIAVSFDASEAGTAVHILHSDFKSEDAAAAHDTGWDSYIKGLLVILERNHPKP